MLKAPRIRLQRRVNTSNQPQRRAWQVDYAAESQATGECDGGMTTRCPIGSALQANWFNEPMEPGIVFQVSKEWPAFSGHVIACLACNHGMIGT